MMHVSSRGLELIKSFEGCKLQAYICPAGYLTIGYGHRLYSSDNIKLGDRISQTEADNFLEDDVEICANGIWQHLKKDNIDVNQNQFDALVSFAFNTGVGALINSKLWGYLKAGDFYKASLQFQRWNKAGGKEIAGLTRRRKAEEELFNQE